MPRMVRTFATVSTFLMTSLPLRSAYNSTLSMTISALPPRAPRATIPFIDGKNPVRQAITLKTLNCGVVDSPCEAQKANLRIG